MNLMWMCRSRERDDEPAKGDFLLVFDDDHEDGGPTIRLPAAEFAAPFVYRCDHYTRSVARARPAIHSATALRPGFEMNQDRRRKAVCDAPGAMLRLSPTPKDRAG
jgi:hypothetical protein